MGGASEPFRLLTLGVALWCGFAPSCSTGVTPASTTKDNSEGVAGEREAPGAAGSGDQRTSAGQAGGTEVEPDEPEAAEGGAASAPKQSPTKPEEEDAAGAASGGAPSVTLDGQGGESEAGGAAAAAPACGKQADGTLCGPNMTPAGPEGARYFCSAGVVVAEAACPGPCDVETNACIQSGGTGGGMGETGFHTLLHCRECYATTCRAELVKCQADPRCVAHLECVETCTLSRACYATCTQVFADEPLLDELNACVDLTGCADKCPAQ
ncbi:MAG: hypothetical protein ABUL60_12325 [Myxococcales bacterium]